MTEQDYMKLVMLHKQKQKEAEDEAYLFKKDNERLRKALEDIANGWDNEVIDGYDMFHIARRALEGKE